MKKLLLTVLAFPLVLLIACTPVTTPSASGSASATTSAVAAPSGSAGASASAGTSAKYVKLQVVVPEPDARAGIDGNGWSVDVIAKGTGPAMERIKPAFTTTNSTGRNPAFPGLVIMLKTLSQSGQATNPNTNLARLFQMVSLPNTNGGGTASISSVTSASATPSANGSSGASGASSASPAGSATTSTRTTASDNGTAEATWLVQQVLWGVDVDVELTAFVVDGDAPDTVSDKSQLKIVSDEITVRFHINGTAQPSGSKAPSSASPSGAPAASPSGSARPSASPSSTP